VYIERPAVCIIFVPGGKGKYGNGTYQRHSQDYFFFDVEKTGSIHCCIIKMFSKEEEGRPFFKSASKVEACMSIANRLFTVFSAAKLPVRGIGNLLTLCTG
jgi:hypothetical protein